MIPVVRVKPGVRFAVIAPAGFRILSAIVQTTQRLQMDLEITSGTDSHAPPDPHASGEAVDVSVRHLTYSQIASVVATLRGILGPLFTVLYETPTAPTDSAVHAIAYVNPRATSDHLHIQKRKGTIFPPQDDRRFDV